MLFGQEVFAWGVMQSVTGDAIYPRDAPEWRRQQWDPVIARLLVERIRGYYRMAEHLNEMADKVEKSLAEYVEDTGDDSWLSDDFLDKAPPDIDEGGGAS